MKIQPQKKKILQLSEALRLALDALKFANNRGHLPENTDEIIGVCEERLDEVSTLKLMDRKNVSQ